MDVLPEEKDKAKDLAVWHQVRFILFFPMFRPLIHLSPPLPSLHSEVIVKVKEFLPVHHDVISYRKLFDNHHTAFLIFKICLSVSFFYVFISYLLKTSILTV